MAFSRARHRAVAAGDVAGDGALDLLDEDVEHVLAVFLPLLRLAALPGASMMLTTRPMPPPPFGITVPDMPGTSTSGPFSPTT